MDEALLPEIDIADLPADPTVDTTVLDVREPHEWAAGHIAGALHIPLGEVTARVSELDPSAPLLVVCHVGGRSARATAWLVQQGFMAINVRGGMDAWEAAGRPISTD